MTCQDMEARIAEFLAGELEDRSGVEAHLVACAECRAQFSIARAGWEGAAEWKAENASGDAIASTLAAFQPVAHSAEAREASEASHSAEACKASEASHSAEACKASEGEPSKPLLRVFQIGTLAASLVIAFVIGTSERDGRTAPAPKTAAAPVASTGLASLRPSVGLLYVQDEDGRPAGELAITRLSVKVDIRDGIARTEIEEVFQNRTDRRLEGTFQFPLPPDASISRLAMEIDGKLMEGEVVERQKARQTYEGIVRSMKDPALLEWMPGGLFQCRIFPIEPRSDKRIVIAYTQALSVFDGRARYVYPLAGESAKELGIGRFEFTATITSGAKIVKAESTSHDAPTVRLNDRAMRTSFVFSDFRPRSDFVVAFETAPPDEVEVSAHRPEGAAPGYFAAFVTPRLDREEELRKDRRLFFLIDASGSFARAELEAARLVIRRMIATLGPADRFRIGCHNLMVGAMAESVAPDEAGKRAADRYLSELAAAGASDVATALETTLSHYMSDNGELVYVGEGTPTWGEKDPAKIVARLRTAMGGRRISIRTIAVGSDAEKGLLETISREFNGGTHAISPSDDVAGRADEIARTLGRSAVSLLKAEFTGAVTDAAPGVLGSLHFGERLLVTGRYGAGPVKLILTGKVHDRAIRREFTLALPEREEGNLHVKRLWAQRRLADLVALGEAKREETVKVSVEHQVMTPYTSFLVLENEKAYEEHRIERTKKAADQQNDPSKVASHPRKKELDPLFAQARTHFEREEYDRCIDTCEQILLIDPRLSSVDEMKMIAQRLNHVKADRDLTRTYIEQWKQTFAKAANPSADELSFPEREVWSEVIRRTRPKGILGEDSPESLSNDYFKLADRYYDSGEFEKAEIAATHALALDPNNAAALRIKDEVAGAVGKGRREGTIGKLIQESPGQAFSTFLDPDGGGGPLAVSSPGITGTFGSTPAQTANGGLALTVGEGKSGSVMAGASYTLGEPDAEAYLAAALRGPAVLPPSVFGLNISVSIPGSPTETLLSLVEAQVEPRLKPPLAGFDIGGVGFTDLDEGKHPKGRQEESVQQLSLQLMQRQAELSKLEEVKKRNADAFNKAATADPNRLYQQQEAERLSRDLGALEQQFQDLARDRQRLQETIASLDATSIQTDRIAPRKALTGQVTAVAAELDLVVISIGRDAGVNEGDEFTIYRSNAFIAKITIDRVDRAWSSGRVTLKNKGEPQIGDSASNNVLATPGKASDVPPPVRKVRAITGDEVTLTGVALKKGGAYILSRDWTYVATVEVVEAGDSTAKTRVVSRLRAQSIMEGDLALPVDSFADLWKVLPDTIRRDLLSERCLAEARLKMYLLRSKGGAR